MFSNLSEQTQLILMIIGLALLFVFVTWNTGRNRSKLSKRKKRDFRKNYYARKKEEDKKSKL